MCNKVHSKKVKDVLHTIDRHTLANTEEINKRTSIFRGEVFLADLDSFSIASNLSKKIGSEQGGLRPVILISNNACNKHSPVVTVVPVTTKLGKARIPTHVELFNKGYSFIKRSLALCEQVTSIDRERLKRRYNFVLTSKDMKRIEEALKVQIGLMHYSEMQNDVGIKN